MSLETIVLRSNVAGGRLEKDFRQAIAEIIDAFQNGRVPNKAACSIGINIKFKQFIYFYRLNN